MTKKITYSITNIEGLPNSVTALDTIVALQKQELSLAARLPQTLMCMLAMIAATTVMILNRIRVDQINPPSAESATEFSFAAIKYSGSELGVIALLLIVGLHYSSPKFRFTQKKQG